MLENIFLIILITILAFFFLFFLFWLFFIRREFQFLKDHIKIRKEIENIQDEEREKRIFSLLNPLTTELQKLQNNITQIEYNRRESYVALSKQVSLLANETKNLEQALKSPTLRGKWGEIQLQRVLELSGMTEHVDYLKQKALADGLIKPDAIVKIPGNRSIAIDAKAPLTHYLDAMETNNEKEKEENFVKHAKNIKQTAQRLGQKEYQNAIDTNLDLVVMFIPGDNFFSAALKYDPDLFENAFNNNVLICTPSTLIALLKGISYNWQQEKLSKNIHEVSSHAKELQIRVIKFFDYLEGIKNGLESAGSQYDKAIGSIQSRILPQIEKIAKLGTMDEKKINISTSKSSLKLRNMDKKKTK